MKIRLRDNTVRLRLTKSDIETFKNNARIECTTSFGINELRYVLVCSKITQIQASFVDNQISIFLPEAIANTWTDTDQISIEDSLRVKSDEFLQILIEKDFQCLTHRGEDDEDTFPNPNAAEIS